MDFKNSTPVELVYLGLPEKYIQTPIWDENSKKYGTMYSLKINDSNYSSLVMSQNNFNLKNPADVFEIYQNYLTVSDFKNQRYNHKDIDLL